MNRRHFLCGLVAAVCAALPCFGEPLPFRDVLGCELETYLVLDARDTLAGKFTLQKDPVVQAQSGSVDPKAAQLHVPPTFAAAQSVLSSAPIRGLRIRLVPLSGKGRSWETRMEVTADRFKQELPFTIPVGQLQGGYYQMHGEIVAEGDVLVAKGAATTGNAAPILLCVRQLRPAQASSPNPKPRDYLAFVTQTIERLLERQSATLGGKADGSRFITVTLPLSRSYRSIGRRLPDGSYKTFWFPEMPMEYEPRVADLEAWMLLDRLSELTGDGRFHDMSSAMAAAFAKHGFDPACGLGFLGEEAGFDVVRIRGVAAKRSVPYPQFKPKNTGTYPGLPLEPLWTHAPAQTHRMFRAMYFGLVTDAASMDFNRYCAFTFNDADQRFALEQDPSNCGFDTAGGRMIHWWASCYAHTGDADCLMWAQKMADKWRAVQHAESGLMPNFFGAVAPKPGAPMPPGQWAESRGAALTAVSYLDAARELRKRPDGKPLAEQLTQMAVKLALGVARHAYDPQRRVFREHLHLDGQPYVETARYTFRTQEEKDAAVKLDPAMAQVKVFDGAGFYQPGSYWEHCAGSTIPLDLAQVMAMTGNDELTAILGEWARDLIEASARQAAAITPEGAWTFRASGEYIHLLVLLWRKTQDAHYLDAAREIADRELTGLEQVEYPDWWRMPERTALLDGLLALHEALASAR